MYIEYRISNLAELLEVARAIHNEVNAEQDRIVHPSEILIAGPVWKHIEFTLTHNRLSDGSLTYDVEAA
jgi:hypothetical protein